MKVAGKIQRNLEDKDSANRTIDLMRREATFSRFFSLDNNYRGSAINLSSCKNFTRIRNFQLTGAEICYKTIALGDLPTSYNAVFKGPCLLVRVGPGYNTDGTVIASNTPNTTVQVLLDKIKGASPPDCYSKTNQGFVASFDPAGSDRLLHITINTESDSHRFSVKTPSNFAYDATDLYDSNRPSGILIGQSNTDQGSDNRSKLENLTAINYTPEYYSNVTTTTTDKLCITNGSGVMRICGVSSKENVFYFAKPLSQYFLSGAPPAPGIPPVPCTYANCYISRIDGSYLSGEYKTAWFSNVDLLVFPDKQIRPTS
jgi:hypothetical protein